MLRFCREHLRRPYLAGPLKQCWVPRNISYLEICARGDRAWKRVEGQAIPHSHAAKEELAILVLETEAAFFPSCGQSSPTNVPRVAETTFLAQLKSGTIHPQCWRYYALPIGSKTK